MTALANTFATVTLLAQVQQGNDEALDNLLRRYQGRVLQAVRYRLGQKLRQKLESVDIVQNVLMDALKKVQSFDFRTEGAFLHYLNRLVENRIRDEARYWDAGKREMGKEQRLGGQRSSSEKNPLNLQDRGLPTPSSIVGAREDYARLEVAMDRLGEANSEQRELIVAVKLEGRSYGEIAKEAGKSRDAVRMQLNRGLAELIKIYRELEDGNV